jgi:hypothetical protein
VLGPLQNMGTRACRSRYLIHLLPPISVIWISHNIVCRVKGSAAYYVPVKAPLGELVHAAL